MVTKLPVTITEAELLEIIKNTKKSNHKIAFALGFYQGMRISEIVNLQPENIDLNQKLIRIQNAKGHKDRNIPISPKIIRKLKHIPVGCSVRTLERSFKKSVVKAGITKQLYFHCLRHSSATHYLNQEKWDIRYVQQFLGHSRLDTTQIYTHVSPQNLLEKMWGG